MCKIDKCKESIGNGDIKLLFINFGEKEVTYCLPILAMAREGGIRCEIYPRQVKMREQMRYASIKKIPFVVLVSEDEMNKGKVTLKNMENGEQQMVTPMELVKSIIKN